MYKENQNKLINVVPDGQDIYVYITAPSKKKEKIEKAIKNAFIQVAERLGGAINTDWEYDSDDEQFFFVLQCFREYEYFKTFFYKEYCNFDLEQRKKEQMYNAY